MHNMRLRILIPALFVLILGIGIFNVSQVYLNKPVYQPLSETSPHIYTPEELLNQVNKERARYGAAPLKLDQRLNDSAQAKADDMVANKYYDHVNPNTGKHGYELIKEYAPKTCYSISENLADVSIGMNAIKAWKTSRPHHEAMINGVYDITGFGIAKNHGTVYYVQHFCQLR